MKKFNILTVIDSLSNNSNEITQKISGFANKKKTFLETVDYLENEYEFEYILWIARPNNIDENCVEILKQELNTTRNGLIIDIASKDEIDTIPKLLKNIEDINMCIIKKEYIYNIQQENNLGNNTDLLFTEMILKVQDIKILSRNVENKKCNINIDSYIKKIKILIELYEEHEEYMYYDIRYIKDLRVIIDELKKILSNKNAIIEYFKKLQPFAKEIINVKVDKLEVIEELFVNQVANREFENAIKTLRYLNREEDIKKEEIGRIKEQENQFYRSKCKEVLDSKSWALTRPLRAPKIWIKKMKNKLKG